MSLPSGRNKIDNCTTALLLHDPSNLLHGEKWTTQVYIQCAMIFPLIHLQEVSIRLHRGMINQEIHVPEMIQHLCHQAFNWHALGDIEYICCGISTRCEDVTDRIAQITRVIVIG